MHWLRRLLTTDGRAAPQLPRHSQIVEAGAGGSACASLPSALVSAPASAPERNLQRRAPSAAPRSPQATTSRPPRHSLPPGADDLEQVFCALASGQAPAGVDDERERRDEAGRTSSAALFLQLASDHAQPLHEFMLDLTLGPTTKQWLEITTPVVANLIKGAQMLEQEELLIRLTSLSSAMQRAFDARGQQIEGGERTLLLSSYQRLIAILPVPDGLADTRALREPLLVHHLLRQVPGVRGHTIDRLYAAGLGSLDALRHASREDLIMLGRLDPARAAGIVQRFRSYCQQRKARPGRLEDAQRTLQKQLTSHIDRLANIQERFDQSEQTLGDGRRRAARSERYVILLDIVILLVQLGEVGLVEKLQRLPTVERIALLRQFAAELAAEI